MRMTTSLPQSGRQPKGSIPLTPFLLPVSLKRLDIKCQKGLFYGGRSMEVVEATIAENPKNRDAPNT